MPISMSVIQNEHGVFVVRKKVPKKLEEAAATVTGASKPRVAFLQRSLRTKSKREAQRLAPPVLMEFDRVLAEAEALLLERPLRSELDPREIKRIADFFYANQLAADEERRREGDSEALFQDIGRQLDETGIEYRTPYTIGPVPKFGLSEREMDKIDQGLEMLPILQQALAKGDISSLRWEIDVLLKLFRINLDPDCPSYRELGQAVLKQFVRALQDIARRQKGEPVDTPELPEVFADATVRTGTLKAALEGWKKAKRRSPTTLREFEYAVGRFVELHGDLPLSTVTRKHVREFREALQEIPKRRSGKLITASLPELLEWSRTHPGVRKLTAATINKLIGGVQAVAIWGRDNGLIPDDVPWSDPFSNMRLDEDVPTREPWQLDELRVLFASRVFSEGARPKAGRGEAAFWLPLLGLYTGARLSELAGLTAADITTEQASCVSTITIREDLDQGRTLKTLASRRVVPIHPELIRMGFVSLVENVRRGHGSAARLFPLLAPGSRGGLAEAWSKWFGRYIRSVGITNPASVFHSFRHGFKDALRAAGVGEDVNDALTGHVGPGTVARKYGAKEMVRRFGLERLADAVSQVTYPALDLVHLYRPD
jgi:integrase